MAEDDQPYQIGYGKPPRATQFKPGSSGNRSGRPKGSKNLVTIVLRECRQKVLINGPRGSRPVTKLEAAVMQLVNKSAQGDLRASREFLPLLQRSEEAAASNGSSLSLAELDQPVLETIRRRMMRINGNVPDQEAKK